MYVGIYLHTPRKILELRYLVSERQYYETQLNEELKPRTTIELQLKAS